MGRLDEPEFAAQLAAPCAGCGSPKHELHSILDQMQPVMLGEAAGTPRWIHDGEKFVDGTYRVACSNCGQVTFSCDDCPRCHAAGALPAALRADSRIEVPSTCPGCGDNQLIVTALVPAVAEHAGGAARPRPRAELGDPGYHIVAVACEECGIVAGGGPDCPICGASGPLRERP